VRRSEEVGAHTPPPHWEVVRAKIVLLASEGASNKQIATRLETPLCPQLVCKWRKRFCEEGIEGLEDRSRSGRETPDSSPEPRAER
jgi:transposase